MKIHEVRWHFFKAFWQETDANIAVSGLNMKNFDVCHQIKLFIYLFQVIYILRFWKPFHKKKALFIHLTKMMMIICVLEIYFNQTLNSQSLGQKNIQLQKRHCVWRSSPMKPSGSATVWRERVKSPSKGLQRKTQQIHIRLILRIYVNNVQGKRCHSNYGNK